MSPRGRELVENEEQDEKKKMKSIVVEEQVQEEGSESESETGFVDLDQDTLLNVLQRVDLLTLRRAGCVNKLWRKVAQDDRLWEPIVTRFWASRGMLKSLDNIRRYLRFSTVRRALRICSPIDLENFIRSDFNSIPDFYSIDPQVFSSQIRPWVQN